MEKTKTKINSTMYIGKSVAWLVETAARAMAGYLILTNFNHVVATVVALYFLGTAAILVATHFLKAYAK